MAHGADEGRATLGRARDSMQLECVQLEVRELRQELQGGLDRLLKALLQPLGELQEALLEARPTPARSEIPDFSAWLAAGAPKRKSERTRAVPKAAPSCDGEGPSQGDGQGRPRRNVVNGQAALDYTYVENNCDSASAVEDASVKSKERSEKSSSMSTLGQHVPRQIHTAQESIKQHLYFSHGLHQVEEFVAEPHGPVRRRVSWLVKTHQTAFEAFIGCIIVANSICIGLEIEISLGRELHGHGQEGQESILAYLEICFLAVYTLELLLRFIADGWDVFRNMWFLFDFSMVAVGGLATVLANHVVSGEGSGAIEVLEQAPLIRNLRLVRLVRAVRMVELFQDLWKLCVGLMKSARTVTSAAVLVTMVAYVFGCAALELIAKSQRLQANPVTKEILDNHFSSLGHVMVTMIQFVNADSIGAIYFPLILENPIVGIFFCMLIGVVSILLMNLVTAAVVESAIKTGKEDLCMQRHRIIKQVEHMIPLVERAFREMDVTQDGR
ncbi:unnamed protein product [Prorocentrum cordatum]|uniref:Ion transport domain-containing protein n=1 Tax=Prorocentrum cordatum TaxID=2364126 RepID=A0ABN9W7F1_9DINO|nr:unnamed protein product [Polarella glacialis]